MLHVTNGDMAADKLAGCGLEGEVLPWREMWIDGPVRPLWDAPEAVDERARYFDRMLGIPAETFRRGCGEQLARLTRAADEGEPIVLWFEHDLFDQAMLASLLHWFERRRANGACRGSVEWIVVSQFPGIEAFRGLSQLSEEQLLSLWPARRPVGEEELAFGAEGWACFAAPDPQLLERWLVKRAPGEVAPLLAHAMRFHLRRFPSVQTGLGAVERETLERLKLGHAGPRELFRHVADVFPQYGIGDFTYWHYLRRMASSGLIAFLGGASASGAPSVLPPEIDEQALVTATAYGRRVAAGQADLVRDGRLAERWLGGVRFPSGSTKGWRYAGGAGEPGGTSMIYL